MSGVMNESANLNDSSSIVDTSTEQITPKNKRSKVAPSFEMVDLKKKTNNEESKMYQFEVANKVNVNQKKREKKKLR